MKKKSRHFLSRNQAKAASVRGPVKPVAPPEAISEGVYFTKQDMFFSLPRWSWFALCSLGVNITSELQFHLGSFRK